MPLLNRKAGEQIQRLIVNYKFTQIYGAVQDAKLFSKIDLTLCYWHCELDDKSNYLTTFITGNGRYCWLRFPIWVKTQFRDFSEEVNESLPDLKGVACNVGDILA